uniref:Zinc transporter 2 n=1 Tax=Syphacia muris TaxID=451379 RepID=A0A0N5AQA5_9BILA
MTHERTEFVQTVTTIFNSSMDDKDNVPLYYCDKNLFTKLPNTTKRAESTLYITTALTVLFIVAEIIGGYLANSLAIITDAGHMISDLFGFVFSLIAIRLARRRPTEQFSFGFHRAEVIGAITSIILIWTLTAILVYLAIMRIIKHDYEVDAIIMIITASVGIVFNIVLGITLHFGKGGAHSHFGNFGTDSHHHNSNHSVNEHQVRLLLIITLVMVLKTGRNQTKNDIFTIQTYRPKNLLKDAKARNNLKSNINVRAAFVHVIGDLVQSVGVLVAAVVIKLTDWKYADPICTFVFSILVLITTFSVIREALLILMEAVPRNINIASVNADLCSLDGVRDVHSLRIWSLTPDKTAVSVHLDTEDSCDSTHVVHEANELLRKKYGIFYITVQVIIKLLKYLLSISLYPKKHFRLQILLVNRKKVK